MVVSDMLRVKNMFSCSVVTITGSVNQIDCAEYGKSHDNYVLLDMRQMAYHYPQNSEGQCISMVHLPNSKCTMGEGKVLFPGTFCVEGLNFFKFWLY